MLVKVKMPKIGLTTEQVEVTAWLKNIGDTVNANSSMLKKLRDAHEEAILEK